MFLFTGQKADFESQMAKATRDNADQRALFDSQMAKAALDAINMKVVKHPYRYSMLFLTDHVLLYRCRYPARCSNYLA